MKNKHYTKVLSSVQYSLLKLILCFMIVMMGGKWSYGQINGYTFSQSNGVYTPISSPVVLGTATALSGAASLDDIVYNLPDGTIPFTFTFNGIGYTGLNVSTNGFITFGATPPASSGSSTGYSPISATTGYDGAISAFGGDCNALFNIQGHTGNLSYGVEGTSPSQEFVIQYTNFRPFSSSSSTTAYWRWSFQIRLHESGEINIVYDANSVGSPSTTTRQVGLRGASNAFPANVNNRLISSGVHTWDTSVNGTGASSTCFASATNKPVAGKTFTWSPPQPCIDPPTAGIVSGVPNPACLNGNVNLSYTGGTGGIGQTMDWEYSSDGSNWSSLAVSSAVLSYGPLVNPDNYFRVAVTCGSTVYSNELHVFAGDGSISTFPHLETFDAVTAPTMPCGWTTENTNAAPGVWANTSTGSAFSAPNAMQYNWNASNPGDDWFFTPALVLDGGISYLVKFKYRAASASFTESLNVFWGSSNNSGGMDQGMVFDDPNIISTTYLDGSFIITPGGSGNYYIGFHSYSAPDMFNLFVDNFSIELAPSCIAPSALSASNITGSSADISWTCSGCGGSIYLEYGPAGFTPGTGTVIDPAFSPQNLSSLAPGTTYDVYVKQLCGGEESPLAGPLKFTTSVCGSEVMLGCGDTAIVAIPAGPGSWSISACGFSTPGIERLYSFTATTTGSYTFAVISGDGNWIDYFIKDASLGCDDQNWTCIDDISSATTRTLNLTGGTTYYILADPEGTSGVNHTFRIVCPTPPSCPTLNNPADLATDVSVNTSLTWSAAAGATSYNVYFDTNTPPALLASGHTTTSYAVGPLANSTTYYWQIEAVNAVGTSMGCVIRSFTTAAPCMNAPVGGTASGPASAETYIPAAYSVTGGNGESVQWIVKTTGSYSAISGADSTDVEITYAGAGTYTLAAVFSSPGCDNDTSNTVVTVVTVNGDNVCDAIPLVVGGTVNGPYTNVGATLEAGEQVPANAGCGTQTTWCSAANQTVWFSFVAPASGRVSIHFSPANWDSEIAVWHADACSDLTSGAGSLIAANDDSASSPFHAWIAPVCLTPGQTYYVQVDGYQTTTNSAFGLYILEHSDPLTDTWYADLDGDGYGDINSSVVQCSAPSGYVGNSSDCDDQNAAVNPGATEICNAIDDDCDGTIDEDTEPGALIISGSPTSLCWPTAPGIGSYSVTPDPFATTYTWTVPAGMFITGGQGTSSITIQWSAAAANTGIVGNVTCTPSNACFDGPVSVYPVSITTVKPVTPGSISGPAKICPGDEVIYSVANVARASFYQWTLPAGCSIVGSSSGNIITVSVDGSFAGGTMSVQAGNACGLSPSRTKGLTFNNPLTPGPISGQASGVCGSVGELYSIGSVANALSYQWSVGVGGTIQGSSTGTMVAVDYDGSLASAVLSVSSVNGCGVSAPRNLTITGAPGVPSVISGPVSVCTGAIDHYSVNTVVGAVSYTWTAPGTVVAGQGTKEVDIMWGSSPASSQQILVRASNDCGDGPLRTLGGISINFCPRISGTELDAALSAYPNPATDLVTVSFNLENSFTMKLNDVTGRNIMTVNNEARGQHIETLDVSTLNGGVYLLVLETADGTQAIRLVVE